MSCLLLALFQLWAAILLCHTCHQHSGFCSLLLFLVEKHSCFWRQRLLYFIFLHVCNTWNWYLFPTVFLCLWEDELNSHSLWVNCRETALVLMKESFFKDWLSLSSCYFLFLFPFSLGKEARKRELKKVNRDQEHLLGIPCIMIVMGYGWWIAYKCFDWCPKIHFGKCCPSKQFNKIPAEILFWVTVSHLLFLN